MKTPHKHAEALAQPEPKPNARPCRSCGGTGLRDTGIGEAPTAICKPCDGTGQIAIVAQPEQETDWEGIAADQAMTIALMKSEQESVAHIGMIDEDHFADVCRKAKGNSNTPLYTSPPKREWVSMKQEDIQDVRQRCGSMVEAVQYINNWLKEKNT